MLGIVENLSNPRVAIGGACGASGRFAYTLSLFGPPDAIVCRIERSFEPHR
jgi:hypothetical protein